MIPVRVPIIDYENPFYCPNHLHFHPIGDPDVDLSIPSFSRKDSSVAQALPPHNYKGVYDQPGTSVSSMHAFLNRVADNLSEEPVVKRKLADTSYDSSPCARILSSLNKRRPVRKRARYTSSASATKLNSFMIPDREWNEPCSIKREHSSSVLAALPDAEEKRSYDGSKERYGNMSASTPECDVEDRVTIQALLLRLDQVFPEKGFREAAEFAQHLWPETNAQNRHERHQPLINSLGEWGALTERALTALHDAEFRHLDLGPTMSGVNKLGLPQGDIMRAFSQSRWLEHLKTLSFSGGRFRDDFDIAYVQPLRQIENLVLANTGIGNEGVFHIVALKHSLRHLDLSGNPSIDDDAIPALILLKHLHYLSVSGTSVLMPGLRRLAVAMKAGERVMDIKIPSMCKDYINSMHTQYLLHPVPPLVSDPGIVGMLSKTALSRNLEAHATINATIVFTGSHKEMEQRLWRILEARKLDLVVREMLVDRGAHSRV